MAFSKRSKYNYAKFINANRIRFYRKLNENEKALYSTHPHLITHAENSYVKKRLKLANARLDRIHQLNRANEKWKNDTERLEKARKRLARIKADRKSNRIRRFRNTSSWFVSWTPTLLLGFLATMFFGGLTAGVIQAHTEHVNYYDVNGNVSQSVSYDVFDYDYTYKLNQLGKLRNIFSVNNISPTQTLLTAKDTLKDYYDKGYVSYTGSNDLSVIKQQYHYLHAVWVNNLAITDIFYTEVNEFLNLNWTEQGSDDWLLVCNMFAIDSNNNYVISNERFYNRFFNYDNNTTFWGYIKQIGKIVIIYPITILVNFGYDLYQVYQFIFIW